MTKKSNVNISAVSIIRIIIFLLIGFICFTFYTKTIDYLTHAPIFAVKDVSIDASIQFIDTRALKQLKGRNIFLVDIKKIHRQIANQYPQIAQLRVERRLPDRIMVLAKKRKGLLQVKDKGKYLLVDMEGVSLANLDVPAAFPIVLGVPLERTKVVLGAAVESKELSIAVTILREFRIRGRLNPIKVSTLQADNPSKIDLTLAGGTHILFDSDGLMAKIDMLDLLLAQKKIDFNQVKYVDLRFKEPVVAQHLDEEKRKE